MLNREPRDQIQRIASLTPKAKLADGRPNTSLVPLTQLLEAEGASDIFPPCYAPRCPNIAVYLLPCSDSAVVCRSTRLAGPTPRPAMQPLL